MENENLVVKHRSCFEIHPTSDEVDTLGSVADIVVGWFLNKESRWEGSPAIADLEAHGGPVFWDYSMPEDYAGGLQDDFWPALATASQADEEGDITAWVMEYDEPDATYEGRRWHTLVSLQRLDDDGCRVGVESVCRSMEGDPDGVAASLAALPFSRDLVELEGCVAQVGTTRIEPGMHRLTAENFGDFVAQVADPERALPYVLFCTNRDFGTAEYAKQLARRTIAMANVYILNHEDTELWEVAAPFLSTGETPITPEEVPCRIYLPNGEVTEPDRNLFREYRPSSLANRMGRAFVYDGEIPTVASLRAAEKPQDSALAARPAEVTEPAEPIDPAELAEPVGSSEPIEPADFPEPAEGIEAAEPAASAEPAESSEPAQA